MIEVEAIRILEARKKNENSTKNDSEREKLEEKSARKMKLDRKDDRI